MDCSYQNRITQSHLLCDHNGLDNRWLGLEKNIWQYISIEVEKNDWFHMYLGIDFIEFVMYWTWGVTETNFLLMTFSSLPLIDSDNIFFLRLRRNGKDSGKSAGKNIKIWILWNMPNFWLSWDICRMISGRHLDI